MIPDHQIDKAAAAIYSASAFGDEFAIDAWHDMADDNPVKTTTRMYARAALEAIAADAWDEGFEVGESNGYAIGRDIDTDENTQNPYREQETGHDDDR